MAAILRYVGRRLLYLVPELLGVSALTFALVRLIPGDPAYLLAGPSASAQTIATYHKLMGLDQPIWKQYTIYLGNVLHGDFGTSWVTGRPVLQDLSQRVPATLELITIGLLISIVLGVSLGVLSAARPGRRSLIARGADKLVLVYGLLAGALPDFWIGLILIFVLFVVLKVAPAPVGQLDLAISAPPHVTGAYLLDALLAGDWEAFQSAAVHLILPELTLVFVYMGPIVKFTRASLEDASRMEFVDFARSCGLTERTITAKTLRNVLPPVITIVGVIFGYLLGGAVLIETVFSWGGLGQYAVQSIVSSDFAAIQAFVLVAAVFTLAIYLAVDLLYFVADPRLRAAVHAA
jgi:ABC-type dipeptide/oligopeptide/nickel transport system permease component